MTANIKSSTLNTKSSTMARPLTERHPALEKVMNYCSMQPMEIVARNGDQPPHTWNQEDRTEYQVLNAIYAVLSFPTTSEPNQLQKISQLARTSDKVQAAIGDSLAQVGSTMR